MQCEGIRMYEGSEELRNLKSRLHAAQVNRDRHEQVVEQLYRKEQAKQEEEAIAESMEYERRRAIEEDITDKIQKSQQRGRVTAINQQQIIAREAAKVESLYQAQREKAQVDEIVAKIEAEDKKEADERREKQEETRVLLRTTNLICFYLSISIWKFHLLICLSNIYWVLLIILYIGHMSS